MPGYCPSDHRINSVPPPASRLLLPPSCCRLLNPPPPAWFSHPLSSPHPQVPEVQLHEPILTTTRAEGLRAEFEEAYGLLSKVRCWNGYLPAHRRPRLLALWWQPAPSYTRLAHCSQLHGDRKPPTHTTRPPAPTPSRQAGVPINLVSYYDDIGATYEWAVQLPVQAVTLDFLGVPGAATPSRTMELLRRHGFPAAKRLGAGVVDGRSVWADDGELLHGCYCMYCTLEVAAWQ